MLASARHSVGEDGPIDRLIALNLDELLLEEIGFRVGIKRSR
jgi:hypothetical protein